MHDACPQRSHIGLLFLRLSVRLTVATHGSQKLFGWFSGPGLGGLDSRVPDNAKDTATSRQKAPSPMGRAFFYAVIALYFPALKPDQGDLDVMTVDLLQAIRRAS